MSGFSFGFGGDDIEDDAADVTASTGQQPAEPIQPGHLLQPRLHSIEDFLPSLPSHISFGHIPIETSHGHVQLPRRELFDIRAQLMAEDAAENEDLLTGLDKGDLTSGVYEGGFKTWECSLDLAQLVLGSPTTVLSEAGTDAILHCVELGAGTAVATMAVMAAYLALPASERPRGLRLTICDYNEAVLRLVTLPNLLLLWNSHRGKTEEEGELEIDDVLVQQFKQGLQELNISLVFISGAWGPELAALATGNESSEHSTSRLILASETIYSPASVAAFTDTLLRLVQTSTKATALVAAKKIYFGVGGGVDDFCRLLQERQLDFAIIMDVRDAGVGRVVLQVSSRQDA